ncbi:MAG TPA: RluA family pseudouridine synthase [Solirubrobacteraceae bacterium]|nr:RluA family pseudouridine synthase [Solirubrobacteraceae bacterium]
MEPLRVPPEAAGERLDQFLAAHVGSRAQAQRRIEAGAVSLDGAPARKNVRLRGGETLVVTAEAIEPAADAAPAADFRVAYEDGALMIVDKPAGVVVHPAGPHRSGTLSQALQSRGSAGGEPWRPGIVHRLDRDTSGLLVVAKSEEAHRRLKAALAAREIVREYLALVEGHPPARSGTIDAPIGRDRRARTRMSIHTDTPRVARTHFELEQALAQASLLRVRLETGRTHQIRAHFKAIGHPVCGDPEYGTAGRYGLKRQFLHAARLELAQPFSGEPIVVASPLPADLAAALELARKE